MEDESPVIINNDNDMLHDWYLKNKGLRNIITYGIENKSDIMAKDIVLQENGSTFTVNINGKDYEVKINIGGNHFISNSLCAICVGLENNIPIEKIIDGIGKIKLTKNRMEIEKGVNGSTIINDCYNAGYDSMKASLEYLSSLKANKRIAILGDILELGEFAKEIHEKVGKEVAKNKIDILITVGELAEYIAKTAKELGMRSENIFEYKTNKEAVEKIKNITKENDYILVKASNGMNFKEITDSITQ